MNATHAKRTRISIATCILTLFATATLTLAQDDGFKPIFDGKTLEGWTARAPGFWTVEDEAITGRTTAEHPAPVNQFITWRQGEVDDFELKLRFRFAGTPKANGGIQIRSRVAEDGHVVGYQADMNKAGQFIGMLYDERGRGIIAPRGTKAAVDAKGKKSNEPLPHADALKDTNRDEDWNDYHIIARGNRIVLKVNGLVTSELTDNDAKNRDMSGVVAFQLHQGPPMKIQYKDIRLKRLPLEGRKKLVFVAGPKTHGYAAHEHNAGGLLLTRLLNENVPGMHSVVYLDGWPKDPTAFDNADAVCIFSDGGGAHVLHDAKDPLGRFREMDRLAKRGVGLAFMHYAVIPPDTEECGKYLLDWIGGYYKLNWSVNPWWVAHSKPAPGHPVARGVKPFTINDEWYFNIKFREGMRGVTPLLTATPPDAARQGKDGPHSGNPTVRANKGKPEHLAWSVERPDGGRGFGFTGAHVHWNWAHDDFRAFILNALAWVTDVEVPKTGVPSKRPTLEELEANQDFPPPKNFKREEVERMIEGW